MKNTFFLVAAGVLLMMGVAHGFSKIPPNCPVLGNWTDPEGTKHMWLSLTPHDGGVVTEELSLNTSNTLIHHVLTHNASASILGTTNATLGYYPSNVTRPDGKEERESVVVQTKCVNDLLWVTVIPVSEESIFGHITAFVLRRKVIPVLSEALPPPPLTTPHPQGAQPRPTTPQFILVNVTLPHRQEDDNLNYMEDLLQQEAKEDADAFPETTSDDKNLNRVIASSLGHGEQLEA